jgi:cation diffusion facilitator family transporter
MSPKEKAAFSSLLVAIFLTAIKLVVGILTNSLAIISEALHSGIDLIAAAMTLFAVMKSDTPPDSGHMYGHYKIENISSFIETLLLYITALWVLYEAVIRLLEGKVVVDISIWAIIVMMLSIILDFSRSRVLYRAAKKYNSQALEADAVHFNADLITSTVVIVGIIPTFFGFTQFDSYAALGVAVLIALIGYRIGKKSIASLMDAAPAGVEKLITEEVRKVEGVEKIDRIRVRESGPRIFVDITIFIDKTLRLEIAHGVTESVTRKIQAVVPDSDVVVHAEPLALESSSLVTKIRAEASNFPDIKNIHNIRVFEIDNKLHVDFHIETEGDLSLSKAHELSDQLEERIKKLDSSISSAASHVEPIDGGITNGKLDLGARERLRVQINDILKAYPEIKCYKGLDIKNVEGTLNINLDCVLKEDITVNEAHRIADQLEASIRSRVKGVDSVSVHFESDPDRGA